MLLKSKLCRSSVISLASFNIMSNFDRADLVLILCCFVRSQEKILCFYIKRVKKMDWLMSSTSNFFARLFFAILCLFCAVLCVKNKSLCFHIDRVVKCMHLKSGVGNPTSPASLGIFVNVTFLCLVCAELNKHKNIAYPNF